MRHLVIILPLLLSLSYATARPSPADTPEAKKVVKRAFELTHTPGLFGYIPPRGDFRKLCDSLVEGLTLARKEHRTVVIYSPDPERATRMITVVFALIRPGELRGCSVVAAVGKKNDKYIRPAVEATGAKLYVEPLP